MMPDDGDDWGLPGQTSGGGNGSQPWQTPNPDYIAPKLSPTDPISLVGKSPPPRRWIVDGWVPHGQVTMLAGDGGIGKTLLAQQLMTSCASGNPWLNIPLEQCRVLGIFCEDDEPEIWRRQLAINDAMSVDMGDLEDMQWISRVCDSNALMAWPNQWESGETQPFFQSVHNAASDFGAQLIVLDSLHDLFGGNENSRPHARQFINALRSLARDIDGAVLLTAHPSLSGRMSGTGESGSTAWNNAVRSRLYLQRPKDDNGWNQDENTRTLTRMKSNYAKAGDEIKLTWEDHVLKAEPASDAMDRASIQQRACRMFMELLADALANGRHVNESRNSPHYAPKVFTLDPRSEGVTKRHYQEAMEILFSKHKIVCENYGSPSRGLQHIVPRKSSGEDH